MADEKKDAKKDAATEAPTGGVAADDKAGYIADLVSP